MVQLPQRQDHGSVRYTVTLMLKAFKISNCKFSI